MDRAELLSRSSSERHCGMLVLLFLFSPFFSQGGRDLQIIKGKGIKEKRGRQLFHFLFPHKFPKENPNSRLF